MRKIFLWAGWLIMTFMAIYLSAVTLVYFSFRSDIFFLLAKKDLVNYIPWRLVFYIHITGGLIALAVGPFQFLEKLRIKNLKLHRSLGKIYVASILFLGGPGGFYMAFFANGGPLAHLGFAILSFLWVSTTCLALKAILKKNIVKHTNWMIRSYALCFTAVTLRLLVPILSIGFQLKTEYILILTAWVSWLINLIVAELIIFLRNKKHFKTSTN